MKTNLLKKLLWAATLILLCAQALSCGQRLEEEEKVRLLLYTPLNTDANPYTGVSFLRISASTEDGDTSHYVRFQPGVVQGDLGNIPFGPIRLEVAGHPAVDPILNPETPLEAMVLSRGASTTMDISSQAAAIAVPILLAPSDSVVNTVSAPALPGPATAITQIRSSRLGHTVTAVPDGKTVIAGGAFFQGSPTAWDTVTNVDATSFESQIEVYDANTGFFGNPVFANTNLLQPRAFHQTIVLSDGRVAFLGGIGNTGVDALNTTEIFDPQTNIIVAGPPMAATRAEFTASAISNQPDSFLLVGGRGQASVSWEVWTPNGVIQASNLTQARRNHTASVVPHLGKIFIMGGENDTSVLNNFEIFNGLTLSFDLMAYPMPPTNTRTMHTATYIESRRFIYLMGGFTDKAHTTLIPQIDVISVDACSAQSCNAFIGPNSFRLATPRVGHVSVTLDDNRVLISGGVTISGGVATALSSNEVIFETLVNGAVTVEVGGAGAMPEARFHHGGAFLETGHALLVGGVSSSGSTFTGILPGLLYNP